LRGRRGGGHERNSEGFRHEGGFTGGRTWILLRPPRHLSHYQISVAFRFVTESGGVAVIMIVMFLYLSLSATPMARKRGKKVKAKKMKKIEPVQRFLYYQFALDPASKKYIDLAAGISAMNGRLMRQGRMYHVANVTMHNADGKIKSCKISTLPDTYTTRAAWHAMFDAWKDQRARVLENSITDISGKWSDFKVPW